MIDDGALLRQTFRLYKARRWADGTFAGETGRVGGRSALDRPRFAGRHLQRDRFFHRRIADTPLGAPLKAGLDFQPTGIPVITLQRDKKTDVVMEDLHRAKLGILLGFPVRNRKAPQFESRSSLQGQRDFFPIQVIAIRDLPAHPEIVRIAHLGMKPERLIRRQQIALPARLEPQHFEDILERGSGVVGGNHHGFRGPIQGHLLLDRGITDSGVGASLGGDLDPEVRQTGLLAKQRHADLQMAAIDFEDTHGLVMLGLTLGKIGQTQFHTGRSRDEFQSFLVKVVTIGDVPIENRLIFFSVDMVRKPKGLIVGKKIGAVDRLRSGDEHCPQQHQTQPVTPPH